MGIMFETHVKRVEMAIKYPLWGMSLNVPH